MICSFDGSFFMKQTREGLFLFVRKEHWQEKQPGSAQQLQMLGGVFYILVGGGDVGNENHEGPEQQLGRGFRCRWP